MLFAGIFLVRSPFNTFMRKGKDPEPDPHLWLMGPGSGRTQKHADPDPQHCCATHLRMPLAFLKTVLQWVSPPPPPCPPLRSQPLCGIMTILTITSRASSMIVRLRSSQEDRFQRTPVTSSLTSLSAVLRSRRTRAFVPPAALIARLFSSFCRP